MLIKKLKCYLGFHEWEHKLHGVRAQENESKVFVIAWNQCKKCAKSKLVWILE